MPLVVISSPKGGVGKTTLVANLGAVLARLGRSVVLVDFDPQNALRLHFGVPVNDGSGYAAQAVETGDWRHFAIQVAPRTQLLPYGTSDARQRHRLDGALLHHGRDFLASRLSHILADPETVVLADTPPGPTPALEALDHLADLHVAVLLSDATSLALLPQVTHAGGFFHKKPLLILNQVDSRRRLNRDVAAFIRHRAEDSLLGVVRDDESLAEAVAQQESILDYAPHAGAVQDILAISQRLSEVLFGGRQQPAPAWRQVVP